MKDKYKSKIIIALSVAVIEAVCTYFVGENKGYRTKRVDGLIPFNKRSVIIM